MGILRTLRLELRPLCGGDIAHVSGLNADPRVMASLGGPLSRAASQAWLDRQMEHLFEHGYARYVVTCGGTFVGLVGLSRTDFDRGLVSGVEVAWRLVFEHWNRGYATEAARAVIDEGFTRFELKQVIAVTSVINARSRRVMDRLGMRYCPAESFDHPSLAADDPLRAHVVYRLESR